MTIQETFKQLKSRDETGLITYITGGFPSLSDSMEHVQVLAENGADIIEIGIPFSDPVADGPTIQASSQAALEKGISLTQILDAVSKVRTKTPLVAMSYLNPLLAYGRNRLFADMKIAGFSGLIIPDLPLEESGTPRTETGEQETGSGGWIEEAKKHEIDLIFLVTPTTSEERLQGLVNASEGFVYCVSLTGITGARTELPVHLYEFLGKIRSLTDKPLAVGFGISTPDHIKHLKRIADGVIIGSRIVQAVAEGEDLGKLVREMKKACKNQETRNKIKD